MRKPDYFFILALPRSRTAWLSNWFTTETSYCSHDPSRFCKGPQDLKKLLHKGDSYGPWEGLEYEVSPKRDYYGSADSVNGWWFESLLRLYPHAKFALINRDINEVQASCERIFGDPCDKELDALVSIHDDLRSRDDIKVVDFDSLNHPGVLQDLQRWLTPGIEFDFGRFELLNSIEMVLNPSKYLHNVQ